MKTGSFRRGDENMQWGLRDLEGIARKGGTSMVSFLYVSLSLTLLLHLLGSDMGDYGRKG